MLLEPDWPAPARVRAFTTTREGGVSSGPYQSFNLGDHVGDDRAAVAANRTRLQALLPPGSGVQWLRQCHGNEVVAAGADRQAPSADACWTGRSQLACAVLTADCLPVLFCDRAATVVAAAHAGWRGLLAGVLERTVEALPVAPGELLAWLGPAIGPARFEVGAEVREAFCAGSGLGSDELAACFQASARRDHYLADLYGLARLRLCCAGVERVFGGGFCTFADAARFYSYRRDGQTGRMASLIHLNEVANPCQTRT
ncbi:peptidoglycan editing factor PgeF [Kineobactrum salinum]|uniref:Purine nucleoside phosphorylase n=1 Tax=Kineobactrum salinum TaxID=2708301 RepID=A0A6C0U7F2_9GAMM|nr:peptidoglycan editing factor PgeF [Kineobactrum salinum]QIB66355.1 peptidoglycan editing factor PgeF [Kineobactrum salinum]